MGMMTFLRNKKFYRILMGIVVVAFVGTIFMIWGAGGQNAFTGKEPAILEINGVKVTSRQFVDAVQIEMAIARNQYGDNFSRIQDTLDFNQQAKDRLIRQHLLLQQADKYGIAVGKEEVDTAIRDEPRYYQLYQFHLQNGDVSKFRKDIRDQLRVDRLYSMLTDMAIVSDDEIEREYKKRNEKAKIKFIEFLNADFRDQVQPSDSEVKQYFESHKENYKKQEQFNVSYLKIDPNTVAEKVQPTEAEIESYYNTNKAKEFTEQEQVKARHILIKTSENASAEEDTKAKAKSEKILKEVKAPGADFAELAKKYSEDPGSAQSGGDLGFFSRGQMVPQFENAAFNLKPGDISDLVKSRFGYHIINVEEKKEGYIKTLDEVKEQIRDKLKKEAAVPKVKELADELQYDAEYENDLEIATKKPKYADLNLKVETTGLFEKEGTIPTIGPTWSYKAIVDAASKMEKGDISNAIEVKQSWDGQLLGYFIIKLIEKKPSYVPNLDEIKSQALNDIKDEKSKQLAFKATEELSKQNVPNQSLEELAKKYTQKPLNVKESQLFSLSNYGYVDGLGTAKNAMFVAFEMKLNEIRGPLKGSNGSYIIQLVERQEVDPQKYKEAEKERVSIRADLLRKKQNEIFESWYNQVKTQAKIKDKTTRI